MSHAERPTRNQKRARGVRVMGTTSRTQILQTKQKFVIASGGVVIPCLLCTYKKESASLMLGFLALPRCWASCMSWLGPHKEVVLTSCHGGWGCRPFQRAARSESGLDTYPCDGRGGFRRSSNLVQAGFK